VSTKPACPYHPHVEMKVEATADGKKLVICPICGKLGRIE